MNIENINIFLHPIYYYVDYNQSPLNKAYIVKKYVIHLLMIYYDTPTLN